MTPELKALASYMAGEFDNREQAIADPAWYVHLHLWQRPVPLFTEDSVTLFAEQANIVNLDKPYRPRILRLYQDKTVPRKLQVQYYMIKDLESVRGAGQNLGKLQQITVEQLELLPNCILDVSYQSVAADSYEFKATAPPDTCCTFSYQNATYQVSLGFEATSQEFRSFDKGIDPKTGKAIWGALLEPFRFTKRRDFAGELAI